MHSVELERLNANITDLDFGENQYICLFWLICAWREPDEAAEGDIVRLYTQWIDIAVEFDATPDTWFNLSHAIPLTISTKS